MCFFRPTLTTMEDRLTPATPDQIFAAAAHIDASEGPLLWLSANLQAPEVDASRGNLGPSMRALYFALRDDQNLFTDFSNHLAAEIAAAPDRADLQALQLNATRYIEKANLEATWAATYAQKLGISFESLQPPRLPAPHIVIEMPQLKAGAPGVIAGDDGLLEREVYVGDGPTATTTSVVRVQYNLWLAATGELVDSSALHPDLTLEEPLRYSAEFPLGTGVIRGFQLGIAGMKAGGIRDLFIPASLAYGANGTRKIPPNSDLVFEVKLISVEDAAVLPVA